MLLSNGMRSVLLAGLLFALGMLLFFWWSTQSLRFGVYAGGFSGIVFGWSMRRLVNVAS